MSDGFGWLEKDRKVAERDLARAYGHAKREIAAAKPEKDACQVRKLGNHIGGRIVFAQAGGHVKVHDPARGAIIATVPRSRAADVAAAVEAAKAAQPAWAATPLAERCRILAKAADLLESRKETLAQLESLDTGKPIATARAMDADRTIRNFRFFAEYALSEGIPEHAMPGHTNRTQRLPVGVVGLVTPWNLPAYLLSWKTAPALAMGNAIVAKPSELTPLTADFLAAVLSEAGLPAGVFNLVHGYGSEAGQALVEHPDARAISFTGGTATGRRVAAAAAPHLKKVSLELGGKNPTIVFADCDLDATVEGVVRSAFSNTGQICLCGSRILVESTLVREFTRRLKAAVEGMPIGNPQDDATRIGALISPEHRAKVESYIQIARDEGATIVTGGRRPSLPEEFLQGAFIEPTIVTDVAQSSRCVQEEIFGPVVTVQEFASEEEAVRMANGVKYGLSASVWTQDAKKAQRVAEALETGMVWINCWLVRDLRVPFGGVKESGIGREGGRHSLDFFSEPKNICVKT